MFIQYRIVTMVQHLVDTQCQFEKHLHSLVFVFFLKNSFEYLNQKTMLVSAASLMRSLH